MSTYAFKPRYGVFRIWAMVVCFAAAAMLSLMLATPVSVQATDCAAIAGKTPRDAPGVDCPAPPCKPNACSCPGGNCNAGCGPITTCVLLGSDPPISDPQWDEPFAVQGTPTAARMISGKCPPPNDSGSTTCPTCKNPNGCGNGQATP
jgi:hypothetical protein